MATVRLNEGYKGSRACHLWSIVTPRKSASGSGVGTRQVREWPLEDGRMFGRDLVPTARSHPAAARVRVDVGRVGPRRAGFGPNPARRGPTRPTSTRTRAAAG